MKRDASIELFRCLCMFGVCLLHALDQGGYADAHRGLDNLMTPCVVGFIFISGWFGIRFKLKSFLKILCIGGYCALIVTVLQVSIMGDWKSFGSVFWSHYSHAWFLWCYLALMMVAPVLEPLFENSRALVVKRIIPLAVLVFVWSYAADVSKIKEFVPHVGGFGGFGLLTFVGIYLVARMCRLVEIEHWLTWKRLIVAAILSGAFCWIGFRHYNSPFALIFAASLFFMFKRLSIKSHFVLSSVLFVAPSTFSIYLIHNTSLGLAWMQRVEDAYIPVWGYYPVCLSVACCFFGGALVLDIPRRFAMRLIGMVRANG